MKDKLAEILGYSPNKEMRKNILERMKREKISIEQAAAGFAMPELIIRKDGTDLVSTSDGEMTLDAYEAKYPHRKLVIIETDK